MIFFDVSFENEKLAENYKQLMRELGTLKIYETARKSRLDIWWNKWNGR